LKKYIKIVLQRLFLFAAVGIAFAAVPPVHNIVTDSRVDSRSVITGMNKSIAAIKTLTYLMVYTERLEEGAMHSDSSSVKFQRLPHKVFMRMSDGAEVLWCADANNGNAWVHPNSFPFVTLELDPDGAIMRKNQHHGVEHAGYDYFGNVLQHAADKYSKDFDSHFLYLGEITYRGIRCYNIEVIDPAFKYVPYTVLKGENIMSIAKKLGLNEYMIMTHNQLSTYNEVNKGQTIMVPCEYAKMITLYISKSSMLPLLLRVDDDMGLFEQYVFWNVKINPAIAADEFSKDNKAYHF
jgi:hypothetical protein